MTGAHFTPGTHCFMAVSASVEEDHHQHIVSVGFTLKFDKLFKIIYYD